jgi:hypothetical protein
MQGEGAHLHRQQVISTFGILLLSLDTTSFSNFPGYNHTALAIFVHQLSQLLVDYFGRSRQNAIL